MSITEQEIAAFLLGAAVGSIITYWNATREKRFVSRVRRAIDILGIYHRSVLTPAQYQTILKPSEIAKIATYDEIIALYPWADRTSHNFKKLGKSSRELHPVSLTAETIICKKLLGLSDEDAVNALRSAKTLDDLGQLTQTSVCKKAILDRIDSVVWPALRKYGDAENTLASKQLFDFLEEEPTAIEAARQKAMLTAGQATSELHHLAEFVRKKELIKDVSSAIAAKCNLAADVSLIDDIAEAFRHRPDETSATVLVPTEVTPISLGFGRTRFKKAPLEYGRGPFEQVIITNSKGETRPLMSILQNVFDAWMRLLDQPLSPIDATEHRASPD